MTAYSEVFNLSHYVLNPYAIPPLIVGTLVALLGISVMVWERASRISLLFCLMLSAASLWLLGCGMMYLSKTADIAMLWAKVYHVGVIFIPICIYLFMLALARRLRFFWLFAAVGMLAGAFCVYILQYRTQFWIENLYHYSWGYYPHYSAESIWFLIFFFITIIVGFSLLSSGARVASGRSQQRLKAFGDAFAMSILASFDFAAGYGIPLYPFGYVWVLGFVILAAHAIWHYSLKEITPAFAADEILETMKGAVLVADLKGKIRLANRSAALLLGYEKEEMRDRQITDFMKAGFDVKSSGLKGEKDNLLQHRFIISDGGKIYDYPMTWIRKNKSVVRVSVSASVLCDAEDQPQGVVYTALDITQRKEAEEALQQSEERLRLLVESVQGYALFMLDTQGNVVTWNVGAQKMQGYRAQEIIGKHFSCFYVQDDVANKIPEEILKSAVREGRVETQGWRVRKDGSKFWAQVLMTAMKDSKGELKGFSKLTFDMTEKKQAEDVFRRFAALVESSNDAIISMMPNGKIASWNPAAQRIFGYSSSEVMGQSVFFLLAEGKQEEMLQILSRIGQGEQVQHYETICVHKNSRSLIVSLTVSPVKDDTGRIIGASAIGRDVTKEQAIEEALRSSEKRLRTIVETANDAFVEINQQGTITDWNKQAEKIFGWTREEAIGKPLHDTIIPKPYREAHRRGLAHYLITGESKILNQRFETAAIRRNGDEFPAEITIWPVKIGDKISFSAFVHDITDRKRAEDALRQRESVEIKSQFVSMVSHELRTPLTAMKLGLDILRTGEAGEVTEKQKEWVDMAVRNVARLTHLINEVLEFQKLESGRMDYDFKSYNLNEVVQELSKTTLKPLADAKKLDFEFFPAPDLPPVIFDKEKICEVLMNMVNNAVKFTSEGKIEVWTRLNRRILEIGVKDTGVGIHPDDMPKLFHFFSQIKGNHQQAARGTGLGLAISKKIVEHHGGIIDVKSDFGKGSTFLFYLPLERTQNPAPASQPLKANLDQVSGENAEKQ